MRLGWISFYRISIFFFFSDKVALVCKRFGYISGREKSNHIILGFLDRMSMFHCVLFFQWKCFPPVY